MKPPPRARTKPARNLQPEPPPAPSSPGGGRGGAVSKRWQRGEQTKLLLALRRLSKTTGGDRDVDYAVLSQSVPTRPLSEIQSVVESLKNRVISCASLTLKKTRREEKKVTKPIEVWTHMAAAVVGTLEETISTAFSQMLLVSSTEPCTLRNCDPPQVHRLPTDKDRPAALTVPLRPEPRLLVQGKCPRTNTARPVQGLKSSAPAVVPVLKVLPPPQHQLCDTAGTPPAANSTSQPSVTSCQSDAAKIHSKPDSQTLIPVTGQARTSSSPTALIKTQSVGTSLIQNTDQPSQQHPTSTSTSSSSSPHMTPCSSATSAAPVPSSAKSTLEDSPRISGVKCVVDFERIYRYLSVIHKPDEECHLTPMESAIVLDLLLSLPEELPLLDCNKLHKHVMEMHQCLSSRADSKIAKEMFKGLKDEGSAQTEAASGPHSTRPINQQSPAEDTHSGGKTLQPSKGVSQSSGSSDTDTQSKDADVMGLCPPLNPFMIPLQLLKRKNILHK